MENRRTCEICIIDVHRASFVKHEIGKKHLENKEQDEMVIPAWFYTEEKTPIKKKFQKYITLKH